MTIAAVPVLEGLWNQPWEIIAQRGLSGNCLHRRMHCLGRACWKPFILGAVQPIRLPNEGDPFVSVDLDRIVEGALGDTPGGESPMVAYRHKRAVSCVGADLDRVLANEIAGNAIPPSADVRPIVLHCEGLTMNRAGPVAGAIAFEGNSATDVIVDPSEQRYEVKGGSVAEAGPPMIRAEGERRLASPLRLTLASLLGNEIDGAWWPRTSVISRELPELVSVLDARLGRVIDINVNWSSLQRQPDLNWHGWRGIHQHVMTITGRDARANLLIVPHRTGTALAVMVLRRAAGLPIYPAHRDSPAFHTADCIVRVARGEIL